MLLLPSDAYAPPQNQPADPKLMPCNVPLKAESFWLEGAGLSNVTVCVPVETAGLVSVTVREVCVPILTVPNAIDDGLTVKVGAVAAAVAALD